MQTFRRGKASLSTKLMRIGAALLIVALTSISLTLWVTWHLEGGAAAVNEAGRMRMQTWRLVSAVQADIPAAERMSLIQQFDESLALLRNGDPSRPLFVPRDDEVAARFDQVQTIWTARRSQWLACSPSTHQDIIPATTEFVAAIDQLVMAIGQQLSRLTAILNLVQLVMVALGMRGGRGDDLHRLPVRDQPAGTVAAGIAQG